MNHKTPTPAFPALTFSRVLTVAAAATGSTGYDDAHMTTPGGTAGGPAKDPTAFTFLHLLVGSNKLLGEVRVEESNDAVTWYPSAEVKTTGTPIRGTYMVLGTQHGFKIDMALSMRYFRVTYINGDSTSARVEVTFLLSQS